MRLSGSARSQRWSIGLRWRQFEYIVMFQKALWDDSSFVTRHAATVVSSHQETVHGGHKGMNGVGNITQVSCRVSSGAHVLREIYPLVPLDQQFYQPEPLILRQDGSVLSRWHPIVTRPSKSHNAKSWLVRAVDIFQHLLSKFVNLVVSVCCLLTWQTQVLSGHDWTFGLALIERCSFVGSTVVNQNKSVMNSLMNRL